MFSTLQSARHVSDIQNQINLMKNVINCFKWLLIVDPVYV